MTTRPKAAAAPLLTSSLLSRIRAVRLGQMAGGARVDAAILTLGQALSGRRLEDHQREALKHLLGDGGA